MFKREKYLLLLIIISILVSIVSIGCSLEVNTESSSFTNGEMKVHFIDVGQGDATFIQTPNGKTILIDAGERDMGNKVISYIQSLGVNTIDVLIATHPHADHIGGLPEVINNFSIGQVYMPKVTHTTKTYEDLLLAIQNKGLKINTAKAGVVLDVDPDIEAVMLAPNGEEYSKLNDYSAILKIVYGESSFIITGDAEDTSEKKMVGGGLNLKADVLRVSHHGSSSSTIQEFLSAVDPKYAVISVGRDNKYGHPHEEVITRLSNAGIDIYRTDIHGNIVISTKGNEYNININQPNQSGTIKQVPNQSTNYNQVSGREININTASVEELQEIIHVGLSYAEQIIELRPFSSINQLTKVTGIGDARLRDIIEEGKAYVK